MLFLITLFIFLIWAVYVIHKGRLSRHSLFCIYCGTLIVVDVGDVLFDYWFDFYDIPTHLLSNLDACDHLGVIISDGFIFPLIAVVFSYYIVRYRRLWLLSLVFAVMLGFIEYFYVKFGFMIYHHWTHWTTPIISFIAFRVLAHFADRLISYNPPISYRVRLLCAVYAITGWPVALLSGVMWLYQYAPVLTHDTANDPFFAILLMTAMGTVAAVLIPKTAHQYRMILLLGLGIVSSVFAIWLHSVGLIQYNHWNNVFMVIQYIAPYPVVYLYDRWESGYTLSKTAS